MRTFNQNFQVTGGNIPGGNQPIWRFGITALDFQMSAASLSLLITANNNNNNGGNFDFNVQILNETVIYRLRIDSLIVDNSNFDDISFQSFNFNCKVLNTGVGYRS